MSTTESAKGYRMMLLKSLLLWKQGNRFCAEYPFKVLCGYSFCSLDVHQALHDVEIEVQQQLQLEEQLQSTQKQEEDRSQTIRHMRYMYIPL